MEEVSSRDFQSEFSEDMLKTHELEEYKNFHVIPITWSYLLNNLLTHVSFIVLHVVNPTVFYNFKNSKSISVSF